MEERVPSDHTLRTIKTVADEALERLSPDFDRMYSKVGRASVPLERLLKASLLIFLYSVRSERAFCEELEYNLLFRWCLDMNVMECSFDPTVFTKNRRRLLEHKIGQSLFDEVVWEADRQGLLSDEHFNVDGMLREAVASIKSFRRVKSGPKMYQSGESGADKPRAVLNSLAYTDLIPVIDGGIGIDTFDKGRMRNATWRSHVIRPMRPCMSCNRQLDLDQVVPDREGLLDDPKYIAGAGRSGVPTNQNVAPLSINVAASLLAQYVSFSVAPAGLGDPGLLRYALSSHFLERLDDFKRPHCPVESGEGEGDQRADLTGRHEQAELLGQLANAPGARIHILRWIDDRARTLTAWLD